jgi:predicted dehydrogenase
MGASRVGVGIVGAGFGAAVAAPAFASVDGVELDAVWRGRIDRAREAATRIGASCATDDIEELCARDGIDLVCVAAPPHLHRNAVLAALDAGKHVVCEKPFGLSPDDAWAMLEAALLRERLHFLDFEFRTEPARHALADAIATGRLGEVRHVTITAMVCRCSVSGDESRRLVAAA